MTPADQPRGPSVANRVITRLDDFARRIEDVPDNIVCGGCGAPLDLLDTSWRSAGENLWEHRCPGTHPQAGCFRGVQAGEPHDPPVTADPGEGSCGTCALWLPWTREPGGYCRVVREKDINERTDTADLTVTTAAHACDVGAWRAKGE